MFTPTPTMLSFFIFASTANAFDLTREVRRFLQDDPAAPFDLSAGLVVTGGAVTTETEDNRSAGDGNDESSGGGSAVIVAVVVILLLLLCCCCFCCVAGGCYYYQKKNSNQKEDIVAQKNAGLGVPYGNGNGYPPQQQQQRYSDNQSHASTSGHMSYD